VTSLKALRFLRVKSETPHVVTYVLNGRKRGSASLPGAAEPEKVGQCILPVSFRISGLEDLFEDSPSRPDRLEALSHLFQAIASQRSALTRKPQGRKPHAKDVKDAKGGREYSRVMGPRFIHGG
jgi:hypothetical protein